MSKDLYLPACYVITKNAFIALVTVSGFVFQYESPLYKINVYWVNLMNIVSVKYKNDML